MIRPRKRASEQGQTLAEFALLVPLMVILIFGFVDVSRTYPSWVTIEGAARDGAPYGVTGRSDGALDADDRTPSPQYHTQQRRGPPTHRGRGREGVRRAACPATDSALVQVWLGGRERAAGSRDVEVKMVARRHSRARLRARRYGSVVRAPL